MFHLADGGAWLFCFKQYGFWKQQSKSAFAGSAITTGQAAKRMATESTVSPADVHAILTSLGGVMDDYMAQGTLDEAWRHTLGRFLLCAGW